MENIKFDEENIPLVQDEDYDNYTLDTGRVDETSFTESAATEATSTLRIGQKLRQDKIVSLYRYLDLTSDQKVKDTERKIW